MENLFFLLLLLIIYLFQIFYVSGKCLNDQRISLLQFRDGLQFEFTYSNKLGRWNQSRECCNWDGVACDGFGQVISLELDDESIAIRNEDWKSLFSLQHLQKLNLAWNYFYNVKIPTELQNLTKLRYLNLSESGFVGQIPNVLSRMKNLVTLDISTRFLEGKMEIINSGGLKVLFHNLTELRELYLDGVKISAQGSKWCSDFSSLSKLQVLSLSNCDLSGPITSSLLELRNLTILRLNNNILSTIVPDFFANFTNLSVLSLVSCHLHGHVPQKIFQLQTLKSLDLSSNYLIEGSLPEFPKNCSIVEMNLGYTNLSGSLPDSIRNLRRLSRIDLSNCSFSGLVPATMETLKELVMLDLSFNKFSGSIPVFRNSRNLVHINLYGNAFTGPIYSAHFEGLIDLEYINLSHNSLNGSIPSSLFTLPSLQILKLARNQFDGVIDEFPNAPSSLLGELDLSSNYLRGPIPRSFFKLKRLTGLYLSLNFFSGTLKLEMFKGVSYLDLSYNNLLVVESSSTGTSFFLFPQFTELRLASCNMRRFPDLKNQSKMAYLDLSLNHITGEIPNWIWKLGNLVYLNLSFNILSDIQKPYTMPSSLFVLDLHANQLGGQIPIPPLVIVYLDYSDNNFNISIPPNIGDYIPYAEFLSLSNNNITGGIPKSICNASYFEVLDLSKNALSDTIPSCLLETIERLSILNLGENNLSGKIPNAFQGLCELRTLDLRRNALEGKIPRSLANCKSLQVLNVGHNNLEGTFPCILMKGSDLRVLILRSNGFQGGIGCPWDYHSWLSLQIIDIAHNNFSGALSPRLFLSFRGMMDDSAAPSSEYLRFGFLELSNLFYEDSVTLTIKGLELELTKIRRMYKTIDFSCNKFHGQIPDTIGELKALYILNLSQNAFTGRIPESAGNLYQLGSLDLSMNQLTGKIPLKLAGLTFLSFVNLSFNQLSGEIPKGYQFQTFPETSFLENRGLCGLPLNLSCNNSKTDEFLPQSPFERHSAKNEIEWEYVGAALGFSVGLGIISWLNFSDPRWWQKFNARVLQLLLRILHQQANERFYRNRFRVFRT